jgi:polysaccharide biosynthesis transport protein
MTLPNDAAASPLARVDSHALELADAHRPYGGRYDFADGHGDGIAAKVLDVLRLLYKRRLLVVAVTCAIFAGGAIRTLMTTPLYTSGVRLQIDRNVAKIVEGGNITPVEGSDTEFLRTQYELLLSRSLARRVALMAELPDDASFFATRSVSLMELLQKLFRGNSVENPPSKRDLAEQAATIVQQNVAIRPIPGSRLVDISYADPNPARAQKIATTYAEAFISSNLDKRFEATAYAKKFLEQQIEQLKSRLEHSEKTMLAFAEEKQIVAVGQSSSVAETDLTNSSAALSAIASERIKNEQLWRQVQHSDTVDFPQFLSSTAIDGLRTKRNDLVTEYQEKLETFKPGYPAMVQLTNKIAEIDRQLAAEIATIRASLKSAYETSLSQEQQITDRVSKLKVEVLDFQKRSIEYNILKREVDSNRELYNGLLQRYKEVDVAGGAGSNNVFVVDAATLPGAPSSPQLVKSLLLSFLLGFGGSVALAYVLENFDDVIDTAEDAERIGGLATLGLIPLVKAEGGVEASLGDSRSPLSEAYRSLCTSLQFSTPHGMPRSIFVTSAGAKEGKSVSSIAIAQHFARLGLKVLLVDADMRNPSLHRYLSADNAVGLSSYLSGACSLIEAVKNIEGLAPAFISSGVLPPNAADLLGSPHLMSLLSESMEVFDLIADALLLSNAAEATIFVIGSGVARAGAVRNSLKRLEMSKAPLLGSVITKLDTRLSRYGYDYAYGYDQTRTRGRRGGSDLLDQTPPSLSQLP